jgi:uncharacterized OB-fold protein
MSGETAADPLSPFIGSVLQPRRPAQDAVNTAMIRHWLEAMDIDSPIHLSDEAAQATGRPGAVAPATMMQSWTQRGYAAHQRRVTGDAAGSPAEDAYNRALTQAGYTGVVATDSEFTFERELGIGELVYIEERLESISPEKTTALGRGRFVDLVRSYTDEAGELVATQHWRTLRFVPKAEEATSAADPDAVDLSLRPHPAVNRDNAFWFEAAREHRLLIQRCASCGVLRHPPSPSCPYCRSFEWDTVEAGGDGTVFSFTIAHHPRQPGFQYPLVVAVVELAEGTRLITNIVGGARENVAVGAPVRLDWQTIDDELTLPVFRIVARAEDISGTEDGEN